MKSQEFILEVLISVCVCVCVCVSQVEKLLRAVADGDVEMVRPNFKTERSHIFNTWASCFHSSLLFPCVCVFVFVFPCVCVCLFRCVTCWSGWMKMRMMKKTFGLMLCSATRCVSVQTVLPLRRSERNWVWRVHKQTHYWLINQHGGLINPTLFVCCSCLFCRPALSALAAVTSTVTRRSTSPPCTATRRWPPCWFATEPTSTPAPTRAPHRCTWPPRTATSRWDQWFTYQEGSDRQAVDAVSLSCVVTQVKFKLCVPVEACMSQ